MRVEMLSHWGKDFGILIRAKSFSSRSGGLTVTPSEVERFDRNGNGWPESTAKGVSTGKTFSLKYLFAALTSSSVSSFHFKKRMPWLFSAGRKCLRNPSD